jgi:hypothetical protein
MTYTTTRIPDENEIEPWFQAVCALWDDRSHYETVSTRGRQIAEERYSEEVSRRRHVGYFTGLKAGGSPFGATTISPR